LIEQFCGVAIMRYRWSPLDPFAMDEAVEVVLFFDLTVFRLLRFETEKRQNLPS
jgi:hypothetical protein